MHVSGIAEVAVVPTADSGLVLDGDASSSPVRAALATAERQTRRAQRGAQPTAETAAAEATFNAVSTRLPWSGSPGAIHDCYHDQCYRLHNSPGR